MKCHVLCNFTWGQSKSGCKDQKSIQSSTTPDPGYQWESDKLTVDTTNESQEVSPFQAGDHKAHINRRAQRLCLHEWEARHQWVTYLTSKDIQNTMYSITIIRSKVIFINSYYPGKDGEESLLVTLTYKVP